MSSATNEFVKEFPWVDSVTIEAQLSFAQAHAVLHSALSRKYAELGISVSRFNALRLLHHTADKKLTITDLGLRLGVSSASVTRLVDGLIRDGWVRRVNGDKDRRVTHVQLLDTGEARFAQLLPRVLTIWNELWAGLSQDQKRLLGELNGKLRQSLLTSFEPGEDLELREY
ncbi:MAG TPA: MarR family transcriptional regulator [Dehalococcoidia bacterium]|nr:MarR family transcriptional regulator [Dehalococcoidia bacterium]